MKQKGTQLAFLFRLIPKKKKKSEKNLKGRDAHTFVAVLSCFRKKHK